MRQHWIVIVAIGAVVMMAAISAYLLGFPILGRFPNSQAPTSKKPSLSEKEKLQVLGRVVEMQNTARRYRFGSQLDRAESQYLAALSLIDEQLGQQDPHRPAILKELLQAYLLHRKKKEFVETTSKFLEATKEQVGAQSDEFAEQLDFVSRIAYAGAGADIAEPWAKQAWVIREKTLPSDDPRLAKSAQWLAVVYFSLGTTRDETDVKPLLKKALTIYLKKCGPASVDAATTLFIMGQFAQMRKNYPGAEKAFKASIDMFKKVQPRDPHIGWALQCLKEVRAAQHSMRQRHVVDRIEGSSKKRLPPGEFESPLPP